MKCLYCNTANPDDAVYCKKCGCRLDGLKTCPSCGKNIDPDSVYCPYCCKLQKPLTDTAVIPDAVKQPIAAPAGAEAKKSDCSAEKILGYISNGSALMTALITLIFVFLIGVVVTVNASITVTETQSLFYYFGKGFKSIKEMKDTLGDSVSPFSVNVQYIPVSLGAVIAACTLILVTAFSITAIVYGILNLTGKSKKSGTKFAIASFISFTTGSVLLLALVNEAFDNGTVTASVSLNGATIAGIVLSALFALITAGASVAVRGKELLNAKSLTNLIVSSAVAVLTCAVLGLSSTAIIGIDGVLGNGKIGAMGIVDLISEMCASKNNYDVTLNAETVAALGTATFAAICVTAIFAAFVISGNINRIMSGKKKSLLAFNIVLAAGAIAVLTLSLVSTSQINRAITFLSGTEESCNYTYDGAIAMLILAVLSLAAEIVRMCLMSAKKQTQTENI